MPQNRQSSLSWALVCGSVVVREKEAAAGCQKPGPQMDRHVRVSQKGGCPSDARKTAEIMSIRRMEEISHHLADFMPWEHGDPKWRKMSIIHHRAAPLRKTCI